MFFVSSFSHLPHPQCLNICIFGSIPLEQRDGDLKFGQCNMYDRNYSDIVTLLHSTINLNGLAISLPTNDRLIPCKSGWNYDRRTFPNTVVMEVNI